MLGLHVIFRERIHNAVRPLSAADIEGCEPAEANQPPKSNPCQDRQKITAAKDWSWKDLGMASQWYNFTPHDHL